MFPTEICRHCSKLYTVRSNNSRIQICTTDSNLSYMHVQCDHCDGYNHIFEVNLDVSYSVYYFDKAPPELKKLHKEWYDTQLARAVQARRTTDELKTWLTGIENADDFMNSTSPTETA